MVGTLPDSPARTDVAGTTMMQTALRGRNTHHHANTDLGRPDTQCKQHAYGHPEAGGIADCDSNFVSVALRRAPRLVFVRRIIKGLHKRSRRL